MRKRIPGPCFELQPTAVLAAVLRGVLAVLVAAASQAECAPLVASYVFYGFWDYRFLFLILLSTIIDFIGGLGCGGLPALQDPPHSTGRVARCRRSPADGHMHYDSCCQACGPAISPESLEQCRKGCSISGFRSRRPLYLRLHVDPAALHALPESARRKTFLVISMVANLGILGFFKYFDFFVEQLRRACSQAFGVQASRPRARHRAARRHQLLHVPGDELHDRHLPRQVPADAKLRATSRCSSASSRTWWPARSCAPHTLLPQVIAPRDRDARATSREGLALCWSGLFKKVVIADNLAPIANAVFLPSRGRAHGGLSGLEVLIGVYAFAFQIYCDFSGYSDIARGISKWLGFELIDQLPHCPTSRVSPSDFWRRWHISLSTLAARLPLHPARRQPPRHADASTAT